MLKGFKLAHIFSRKNAEERGDESARNRARERRRAAHEAPSDDSGRRDRPEGHIEDQLRHRSRLALAKEAVPQPCHERPPVEREVKAEPRDHHQRWQSVEIQLVNVRNAATRRTTSTRSLQ